MAEMYIFNVKKYNQYHQVFGIWRAPDNHIYNFEISIDKAVNMFLELMSKQKYPHTFMLLNIIRIAALLSFVINSYRKVFCKIIVLNGDYSKFSPYLQIYDRGFSETKEISINILPNKINELISEYKDDVILLNDEINTSDFKRKNGEETIKRLAGIVSKSDPIDHPFIPYVVSERLGAFLDGDTLIQIDASKLDRCDSSDIEIMYEFDKLIMTYFFSHIMIFDILFNAIINLKLNLNTTLQTRYSA